MDRNASLSIVAAIIVSVVGVFGLMTMPMAIGIYVDTLGFTLEQGNTIMIAEVAGGAIASILAIFWVAKINWRKAIFFALTCVIVGNALTVMQTDSGLITLIRFVVGFLGQGTAFAIGISIIGNTSDPDRNFGFVIAAQVAFGVITLIVIRPLVDQFNSIGGMYIPLAALAAVALLFLKFVPEGAASQEQHGDGQGGSLALPIQVWWPC